MIFFLYGWVLLVTFVTVCYPALKSIRAIESAAQDDDKTWLTYWMVYGVLVCLETYVGFLLEMLPYWHWIRLVFFVWLLFPTFNGAEVLYEKVLKPFLLKHEKKIKELIEMTQSAANEGVNVAAKAAADPTNLAAGLSAAA